jgi:hypothetical protein
MAGKAWSHCAALSAVPTLWNWSNCWTSLPAGCHRVVSGVQAWCRTARLAPVPGSFVDEDLRWRHSDVLFTAPLDGRDAFVYVLVEHQSSDDPLMAFRVLRYITRIWGQYEREHPKARRLPAVIPLVVYQGPGRWASPVQLPDVIDLEPADKLAVHPWLPRFEFLLDDLSRVSEDQLLDRKLTPAAAVTLLLLKNSRGNLTALLRRWKDLLRAVLGQPGGGEEFTAMLAYIALVVRDAGRETARPSHLARPRRRGGVHDHRRNARGTRRGTRQGRRHPRGLRAARHRRR